MPDNTTGIGRREPITLATFWDEDGDRRQIESAIDPGVLQFVRDQLGTEGSICSDRLRYQYGEWCRKLRDESLSMKEVVAGEKLLREWVNRYWNRPEMGAWVCCKCVQMPAEWSETVEAIRRVQQTRRTTVGRIPRPSR